MAKGVHDQCVKTNLDALLIELYVHLDDHVLPSRQQSLRGRPRLLTDAELVCVAVAQVLLRCDEERRWLRWLRPGSDTCSRGCRASPNTTGTCARWGRSCPRSRW